jgi:hypothetical protein
MQPKALGDFGCRTYFIGANRTPGRNVVTGMDGITSFFTITKIEKVSSDFGVRAYAQSFPILLE